MSCEVGLYTWRLGERTETDFYQHVFYCYLPTHVCMRILRQSNESQVWMAAPFTSSETSRLYHWEWVDSYFSSTWCFSLAWFFHILSVLVLCLMGSWLIHSHDSLPAALVGSTFNNHSSVNQISNHRFKSWSGEWMKHRTKFMYHQGCMALMDLLCFLYVSDI